MSTTSLKIDFPARHNNYHYVLKTWTGREWKEVFRSQLRFDLINELTEGIKKWRL